jgi:hypothetical protein
MSARTKAIIAVHLAGWPCDMDPILQFAAENGLKVIEDCAQAHGAIYKGRPVGSLGDVAAFSFCQDKIISTGGEGGMLVTNSQQVWEKAWSYKDHGKSYDEVYNQVHPIGFRWLHTTFGTNWRMTEMQAAIGRIELCKLPTWNAVRNQNAKYLRDRLINIPALRVPVPSNDIIHAYYKFDVFVRPQELATSWSRDRIMGEINSHGVFCSSGSCSEIYLEKAFDSLDLKPRLRKPNAKELGETTLSFLVHPRLDDVEMNEIASTVESVMSHAAKKHLPITENIHTDMIDANYVNSHSQPSVLR